MINAEKLSTWGTCSTLPRFQTGGWSHNITQTLLHHAFSIRDIMLTVIIAVASGLACLSLLLLVAFCLFRQRRKDVKHCENELGSLEARLSPVKQIQRHRSLHGKGDRVPSPLTLPILHKPTSATHLDSTVFLEKSSLKPPLSFLSRPNHFLSVPAKSGVSRATAATERSQTASIYSTESAPLHLHDQISNPLFVNRVVLSNITRASLPRGMNLPSNVTRDIGLFITPGTPTLLPNSNMSPRDNIYFRASAGNKSHFDSPTIKSSHTRTTHIPQSAHFTTPSSHLNRAHPLYQRNDLQALRETASTSSFPPPLW
jgi:hypothetical protein